MMKKKVLILEDEDSIRGFIVVNLKRSGYEVLEASTGTRALEIVEEVPDIGIAVLDVMLPDIDGYEVCRRIRERGVNVGIIMLTALSQETDKVTGLMNGADDYVTKPFSVLELTARVEALYRRIAGAGFSDKPQDVLISGPFELDTRSRELKKNGERVDLTQVEYIILKTFMENKNKALSREEILNLVWKKDYPGDLKIVDVNIRRLRLKIEENAATPRYITTLWGFGYKWE